MRESFYIKNLGWVMVVKGIMGEVKISIRENFDIVSVYGDQND